MYYILNQDTLEVDTLSIHCLKYELEVKFGVRFRGGRYIDEKLSKADKSVPPKLLATYRYRKMEILKLSNNYRYRKMHQILADN